MDNGSHGGIRSSGIPFVKFFSLFERNNSMASRKQLSRCGSFLLHFFRKLATTEKSHFQSFWRTNAIKTKHSRKFRAIVVFGAARTTSKLIKVIANTRQKPMRRNILAILIGWSLNSNCNSWTAHRFMWIVFKPNFFCLFMNLKKNNNKETRLFGLSKTQNIFSLKIHRKTIRNLSYQGGSSSDESTLYDLKTWNVHFWS